MNLLLQLGALWPPIRERLEGYPKTRSRIAAFIESQPENKRAALTELLLPENNF